MAKCIMELERIKGIKRGGNGSNQYENKELNGDNLNLATQKDLAEELNISQRQLADYKKLTNLIPELQKMIENGSMKATVGYKIWAKMPQEKKRMIQLNKEEFMKNMKDYVEFKEVVIENQKIKFIL